MRFNLKKPPLKEGDTNIIRRFLFLPKGINEEWRWLEFASYEQEVKSLPRITYGHISPGYSPSRRYLAWVDTKWVDNVKFEMPPIPQPRPR